MDYTLLLIEQFTKARGYRKIDNKSGLFGEEYYNWLKEQRLLGKEYLLLMREYLNMNLNNEKTIELNKGKYDSIISDGTLISPFAYTMDKSNSTLLVEDFPIITSGDELYSVEDFDMFTTHNAYNEGFADTIPELCNMGYNVCYGVFGKNSDKDKEDALALLKKFYDECDVKANIAYEIIGDSYIGALYSKTKVKKLVKNN